jgi:hypothetical protein
MKHQIRWKNDCEWVNKKVADDRFKILCWTDRIIIENFSKASNSAKVLTMYLPNINPKWYFHNNLL